MAEGDGMPRPLEKEAAPLAAIIPGVPRRRYLVMRRQELWFIAFDGQEFGPYQTEREAMLFAVDAAHQFGEQGEETQVLSVDENGDANPVWTYGLDPYPLTPE
jgi:hypothetical protein